MDACLAISLWSLLSSLKRIILLRMFSCSVKYLIPLITLITLRQEEIFQYIDHVAINVSYCGQTDGAICGPREETATLECFRCLFEALDELSDEAMLLLRDCSDQTVAPPVIYLVSVSILIALDVSLLRVV